MGDKRKILSRLLTKEKQQEFNCLSLKHKDFITLETTEPL